MVTVAEELPFVAAVNDDKLDTVCSNCFAVKCELNQIDLKKCGKCCTIFYCSKKCQKEDWIFHKDECRFIVAAHFPATKNVRFISRFIMRVKREDLPVAFNGRTFNDLVDHKEEMMADQAVISTMNRIHRNLSHFMGCDNVPPFEEFFSLCGKIMINSFNILHYGVYNVSTNLGMGLYLGFSVHNHSCNPNAQIYFNGSKILLRANDSNSEYSTNLTITYINLAMLKEDRQKALLPKYYFDCKCERCMDEESELWDLSGKSDCCPMDGAVLPVDKKFLWYWQRPLLCTHCGKKSDITLEQINETNKTVAEMCAKADEILANVYTEADLDNLVKLLDQAELSLSPYNLNVLQFIELIFIASEKVHKESTFLARYRLSKKKALERYPVYKTPNNIIVTIHEMLDESVEGFNLPREIAHAKFVAAVQKALDVVKEAYGSEHPLYKEIEQLPVVFKNHHDKKFGYKKEDEKKAEINMAKGGGDY